MTNESPTPRDIELRRLLVARASGRKSRPRAATVGAVAGSLGVAGALTAVVIFAANPALMPQFGGNEPYEFGTPTFVYDNATIIGEPVQFKSHDSQVIDLGEVPTGANALGMELLCFAEGTYSVAALEGLPSFYQPLTCDGDATIVSGVPGGYIPFAQNGATQVQVAASPGGEYAVWLAWIAKPADPEPSAEQTAALADGEVTRDEYVAGYDRYAACLEAAGFTIDGNRDGEIIMGSISSEAVSSGVDDQCYISEFRQVDIEWQAAHPQTSLAQQEAIADLVVTREEYLAGFDRFAQCMAALGASVRVEDREAEVLSYEVEADPALSGEAGRCYRSEFFHIETSWKMSVDG